MKFYFFLVPFAAGPVSMMLSWEKFLSLCSRQEEFEEWERTFFCVFLLCPKKYFSNISIKLTLHSSKKNVLQTMADLMKIMLNVIQFRHRNNTRNKSCFSHCQVQHILLSNNGNLNEQLIRFSDFVLLFNKIIRVKQLFK